MVNASKVLKACVVKAPGFGDEQGEMLDDIAILTGGKFITEDLGLKLDGIELSDLGTAANIVVEKENTIIIDGGGGADGGRVATGEGVEGGGAPGRVGHRRGEGLHLGAHRVVGHFRRAAPDHAADAEGSDAAL